MHLFSHQLLHSEDVVETRRRAARIAALLGFDASDQTRIATAVSEIARNAVGAGGGSVVLSLDTASQPPRLVAEISDTARGIRKPEGVLAGRPRSATAVGIGVTGAAKLMDGLEIRSAPLGTTVVLHKHLPPREVMTQERAGQVAQAAAGELPGGLLEEFQQQHRELLSALEDLVQLNRELEDTNHGVMALYAELDESAAQLQRAEQVKSRFLSNMTHEFRTPVNAILGLCNLLVDDRHRQARVVEPEVLFIRQAADQLSDLVNDLLDLAKVEAGKSEVRPTPVDVPKLFGALRGMLRPLLLNPSVVLAFEPSAGVRLFTDETKLSQILRNLISNALKYTERGEVRISAELDEGDRIAFRVADTGIGIAREDQQRIFEEFTQVEHRLQRGVHGTGLGLPLSRRFAELLGGDLSVQSQPGTGSVFTLRLPSRCDTIADADLSREQRLPDTARASVEPPEMAPDAGARVPTAIRALVIDDEEVSRFVIRQYLAYPGLEVIEATTAEEGLRMAREERPHVILLDLVLAEVGGREALNRLRSDPTTAAIPVVIVSAAALEDGVRDRLLQQAVAVVPKTGLSQGPLREIVRTAARHAGDAAARVRPDP